MGGSIDKSRMLTDTIAIYEEYLPDVATYEQVYYKPLVVEASSDASQRTKYSEQVAEQIREKIRNEVKDQTYVGSESICKEMVRVSGPYERFVTGEGSLAGHYTTLNKDEYLIVYALQRCVDGLSICLAIVLGIYRRKYHLNK